VQAGDNSAAAAAKQAIEEMQRREKRVLKEVRMEFLIPGITCLIAQGHIACVKVIVLCSGARVAGGAVGAPVVQGDSRI
jgi:hypothetical protein